MSATITRLASIAADHPHKVSSPKRRPSRSRPPERDTRRRTCASDSEFDAWLECLLAGDADDGPPVDRPDCVVVYDYTRVDDRWCRDLRLPRQLTVYNLEHGTNVRTLVARFSMSIGRRCCSVRTP